MADVEIPNKWVGNLNEISNSLESLQWDCDADATQDQIILWEHVPPAI